MDISIKTYTLIILLYYKHIFIACFISDYGLHPHVGTYRLTQFNRHNIKNSQKYTSKQLCKVNEYGLIPLKALDISENDIIKRSVSKYKDEHTNQAKTRITQSNILRDALASNSSVIILASIYLIKIFRLLLYCRFLMDSLTNINPFMPPFSFIYETTNLFTKFSESLPKVAGLDLLSDLPWFLLNYLERYLMNVITPKT